jgi:uncharacterized membrane protein
VIRVCGGVLLAVAYVLGTHVLMTQAPHSPWSLAVLFLPMGAAVALAAWRSRRRAQNCLLVGLTAGGVLALSWGLRVSPPVLYAAQHVGTQLFLAAWFFSTLRPGVQPLISRLAALVHPLTPGKVIYTRKLTMVWVAYFLSMAGVSALLFAVTPFEAWAVFANLGTPVTLAGMLVGEYLLRYRLHPEFERTTLQAALQAYRKQ